MALVVFGSSPLLVMALDGPVLALSDIMHGIAPSPVTPGTAEDDPEKSLGAESSTPEPLDNAQIELMRNRVLELIVSGASKMNTSSREKELLEMVPLFPYLFMMNSSAKCLAYRSFDSHRRIRLMSPNFAHKQKRYRNSVVSVTSSYMNSKRNALDGRQRDSVLIESPRHSLPDEVMVVNPLTVKRSVHHIHFATGGCLTPDSRSWNVKSPRWMPITRHFVKR
jgi:hypothetical protein